MTGADIMWVEKYRPQKLGDIVGQSEAIGSLSSLLKNAGEMPHLMFSGSAGVGKTTTALCIAREILGDQIKDNLLELNASDERGIGMVREKIKTFSRYAAFASIPFKIIILDEADEMTSDAQTALRRTIEDASEICRFILIANNISKIIEPIQSRCAVYKFPSIPRKEMVAHIKKIAKKEKVTADAAGIDAIYDAAGGDLRHAINLLQAVSSSGAVTADGVRAAAGLAKTADVASILDLARKGALGEARKKTIELLRVHGMSESDFLKYMAGTLYDSEKDESSGRALEIMAEYDYRILSGANPEIQLAAMLSELCVLYAKK